MEALTAVSVALLTVDDRVKGADRAMEIEKVRLLEKTGGTRGDWRRDAADGRRIDGAVPVWGPPGHTREGYAHDNPETDAAGRAHSPWRSGCEQHRRLGSTRDCRRPAGAAHGARADRGAALPRAGTRGDPGRTRGRPAAARARQRDHRLLDALRDRGRPGSGDLRRRPRRGGGPGAGLSPRESGVGIQPQGQEQGGGNRLHAGAAEHGSAVRAWSDHGAAVRPRHQSAARLPLPPGSAGALRRERRRQAAPGAACLQPRAGEGAGAARRREGPAEWLCGGPYERLSSKKLKT